MPPGPAPRAERLLVWGLAAFAAYHLGLGLYQSLAPHSFFVSVGPFGVDNPHYTRDNATYALAVGATLAVAVRQPSWRVPVLALTTLQFVLHSGNHLLDIDRAHPHWLGAGDFVSLAVSALLLAWLLRCALRAAPPDPHRRAREGRSD